MLVVLDIFFDNIFRHFVPYRSGKVSVFPKFTAPQLLFHLRVSLKNPSRTSSLQTLHDLRNRIAWWKSKKYVHMILGYFHRFNFKIIIFRNFFKTFFNKFTNVTPQYPFTIFRRPYKMISRIIYRMTCSSICHAKSLIDFQSFLKDDVSSPP